MRDAIGYGLFLFIIGAAVFVVIGLYGCEGPTEYVTGPAVEVPVPAERDTLYTTIMIHQSGIYRGIIYTDDTTGMVLLSGPQLSALEAALWQRYTTQDTAGELVAE